MVNLYMFFIMLSICVKLNIMDDAFPYFLIALFLVLREGFINITHRNHQIDMETELKTISRMLKEKFK